MAGLGSLGLFFALILLGLSVVLSLFSTPGRVRTFLWARICFFGAGCLALWCCSLLILGFLLNDFSLDYVVRHSSLSTPWYYRLTAFWAGQEGSCLLWLLLIMASIGVVSFQAREVDFRARRRMILVSGLISGGLLGLTLFQGNPFARVARPVSDGMGLNFLLQNWAMIVHPPLLFAGYAFLAVVFVLVFCRSSEDIAAPLVARWSRWACAALTAGIAIGALWAYDELGWGGYWGWDPVENASLLPWLATFALIHFVPRQITRIERSAVLFAGIGFGSTILASYLTRSGVVYSVHGFADGNISWLWLIFLGLVLVGMVLRTRNISDRETAPSRTILITGLFFLLIALAVLVGTLWPVLGKLVISNPQPLRPEFYNSVVGMLGLGLLILLAWCAIRGLSLKRRIETLVSSATVASVTCFSFWFLFNIVEIDRLLAIFIITGNVSIQLIEMIWYRKHSKTNFPRNLAHLGLGILAAGLTASMVQSPATSMVLKKGQSQKIGPLQVTLKKVRLEAPARDRFELFADLEIRDGGRKIELHPRQMIWMDNRRRVEIDYHTGVFRDLYATLDDFDESHAAMITVRRNWLVSWVWAGSALILVASVLAGLKRGRRP